MKRHPKPSAEPAINPRWAIAFEAIKTALRNTLIEHGLKYSQGPQNITFTPAFGHTDVFELKAGLLVQDIDDDERP